MEPAPWSIARAACEQLDVTPNGPPYTHLVVFEEDPREVPFVAAAIPATESWVGLTDAVSQGNYIWIAGDPGGPWPTWSMPEAGALTSRGCGTVVKTSRLLDRTACSNPKVYVCQCDERPADAARWTPP